MRETAYLLQNKGGVEVTGGRVVRFQLLLPQGIVFSDMCETNLESRGGGGGGGESAQRNVSTQHACASKRGDNAANN